MKNKDIIMQYINTGLEIPDNQIKKLNGSLLNSYLRKRNIAGYLNNLEFNLCPNDLKLQYIETQILKGRALTDEEFNWCSNDLKLKYIETQISNNNGLTDEEFNWCSDDLKLKYIEKRTLKGRALTDKQFNWCLKNT